MNHKDIRLIRRRFNDDLDNFSKVYGCYVNAAKEVVARMELQVLDMGAEERDMYLKVFRKSLSGSLGRTLMDVSLAEESSEELLLESLNERRLRDAGDRDALYSRIIDAIEMPETSFVILLIADSFDLMNKGSAGDYDGESYDVFDYFVCCVCPVKDPKSALRYLSDEKSFRGTTTGSILGVPQIGFVYPALVEGGASVNEALYYSRSSKDNHEEVIKALFDAEVVPMAPDKQRNAFSGALEEALEEECSMDVVKLLQSKIITNLEEHKENKDQDAPELLMSEIQETLRECGVSEERVDGFKETCERYFNDSFSLNPNNLMSSKVFEVKNSEISVKVSPDYAYQVKTEVIDGRNYILIPVGEGVMVNGIEVNVSQE